VANNFTNANISDKFQEWTVVCVAYGCRL